MRGRRQSSCRAGPSVNDDVLTHVNAVDLVGEQNGGGRSASARLEGEAARARTELYVDMTLDAPCRTDSANEGRYTSCICGRRRINDEVSLPHALPVTRDVSGGAPGRTVFSSRTELICWYMAVLLSDGE